MRVVLLSGGAGMIVAVSKSCKRVPIQGQVDCLVGSRCQSKFTVREGVVKAFAFLWVSVKHGLGGWE